MSTINTHVTVIYVKKLPFTNHHNSSSIGPTAITAISFPPKVTSIFPYIVITTLYFFLVLDSIIFKCHLNLFIYRFSPLVPAPPLTFYPVEKSCHWPGFPQSGCCWLHIHGTVQHVLLSSICSANGSRIQTLDQT